MNPLVRFLYNLTLARRIYRTAAGRFLFHLPADLLDTLRGRRDPMAPPRWRLYTGRGGYRSIGEHFLTTFREAGLQPHHRVLEIGSGMGRMALPLADYLAGGGEYDGVEIVRSGVRWCSGHITRRYPHIRFHHADIRNRMYNPRGRVAPDCYSFPFGEASFDFVFLTSVFTHMEPRDVQHYLVEISRMLVAGGTAVVTVNIINDRSLAHVRAGKTALDFRFARRDYWTISENTPEFNIGLSEEFVRRAYAAAGLVIVEPIWYGEWSGFPGARHFQDVVVARKPV